MVCQAASQTRFRALKHENAIPGRAAIVVKVIACFQHLQHCQAEYFRHLLKPVTTTQCSFGVFPSSTSTPTHLISFKYSMSKKFHTNGLGVLDKPSDASYAPGKRFLIFDRSGNQTRLYVSPCPYLSCQKSIISPEVPAIASVLGEKVAYEVDQQLLVKADVEEEWDENNLNDGEGEMLEDAEEINDLLYSDSDDEYDDGTNDGTDSENDEVSSMRHTLHSIEDCGNKGKSHEEVMEEVASSDGSPKRRKLLDGGYKKSSLVGVESPDSSRNHKDGVESHRGGARTSYLSKKVKVHKALKTLRSIIPNLSNKDPLSIIEKAIVYLETMKDEAKALGVS